MQAHPPAPASARAGVLLVDDEPQVLEGLALSLRGEPYDLMTARSASDAFALLGRVRVDLVVSDEHMPGMRGSEFLARVAREWPRVGRVMLTGHASLDVSIRCINEGAVTLFLQKPCLPGELRRQLGEALQRATVVSAGMRFLEFAREQVPALSDGSAEKLASPAPPDSPPELGRAAGRIELWPSLSSREREVAVLLLEGKRTAQVAKTLCVSMHTVRNHLKAIFRKLDVHSQAELLEKCGR